MPRKTTRLYYGLNAETGERLYWTMKVRNATKPVTLNGTVEDAMKGKPGLSIGCHLSHTAYANRSAFGHPALYISFTKTVALVVTKINKGAPTECVRYRHHYGKYVDLNDMDPGKTAVKEHPELFNRPFTLGVYREQENHWKPEYGRKETGERSATQMARGELARMHKAGLMMLPV
ncbi:MAG: hypothetical protein ABWY82_05080 [Tardiphaga sp.]